MAMINCPECGKEVSSEAATCPNCGHPIKQPQEEPMKPGKSSSLKTGAIVNVIAGVGFMAMLAFFIFAPKEASNTGTTVTTAPAYGDLGGTLWTMTFLVVPVVTVLSIIILAAKAPKRKPMLILAGVQLALAVAAAVVDLAIWNLGICCGVWIMLWGTVVQLIGSILCMSGALKLDE